MSSRIPEHFIDDLLSRLDVVEVIDSRVKLKKAGKNYSACCPFHDEKTPSFTVSPDKQFYYCFGCGATGSAIGFVMEYDRLSFPEAVEQLAQRAGLEVPREEQQPHQPRQLQQKSLYSLLTQAEAYYIDQLKQHPQKSIAVNYLQNRGLSGKIARDFRLGYAPAGWDNLLVKFGLNEEDRQLLNDSGMVIEKENGQIYDRFRQRIMFPIHDTRGRVIGFGARVLDDSKPKYLNSPETPVFQKGRELYGLYEARQANRNLERLLVVEGYMDVIALAQYGISYGVATLGTACGADHLRLAFRFTSEVIFCFDGDQAGRTAAKRALENALPIMEDGRQIKFLFLPEGQDPDSLVRQIGKERFMEQINRAQPLEGYFFDALAEGLDIGTMEGRARLSKLAAPLLDQLPKSIFRELMFNNLAKRTGLSRDVLQELITEAKTEPLPQLAPPVIPQTEPQSPSIAIAPNKPRPKRVNLNPARLATAILLDNPSLALETDTGDLPRDHADEDLNRLSKLLAMIRSNPNSSFNSLIGAWGGLYGIDSQQELVQIVANQLLNQAKQLPIYQLKQELLDNLDKIRCDLEKAERQRTLASLQSNSISEMGDEEKNKIRELIHDKTKRDSHGPARS